MSDAQRAAAPADVAPMRRAIELADAAAEHGDVPIGAVLVLADGRVIESCNEKELRRDATAHAEMLALRAGARLAGAWRLHGATLYVTKEPCVMCAGALVAARIERLVFGCYDPKGGAAGSVIDLVDHPALNHRIDVLGGVLEAETALQLQRFFAAKRGRPRAGDGEGERDIR
jgi:tRNA(adenine34) deaminase